MCNSIGFCAAVKRGGSCGEERGTPDPSATLKRIRRAVVDIGNAEEEETFRSAVLDLTNAFADLDQWLSKGGYLPTEWQHYRHNVDLRYK